jgi:uncharacterized membrane protein YdjX (TVP38/TMEM64 family)
MPPEVPASKRKLPVVKLALLGLVLAVAGLLVLRGLDIRGLADSGMAVIRDAGPWAFFSAMTIVPAFGVPMLAFTVPAGEAFRAQLGLGPVIALALTCIALNLAFGYWVSRYALRPLLGRLIERYGYTVPRVTPENALNVTLLVRLTPGPPYAMQAWLLGCAEVPFRLYMIVSWLAVLPYALAGIILGEGLFKGNFKLAAAGLGLLVAVGVGVNWLRRKYTRRET